VERINLRDRERNLSPLSESSLKGHQRVGNRLLGTSRRYLRILKEEVLNRALTLTLLRWKKSIQSQTLK